MLGRPRATEVAESGATQKERELCKTIYIIILNVTFGLRKGELERKSQQVISIPSDKSEATELNQNLLYYIINNKIIN